MTGKKDEDAKSAKHAKAQRMHAARLKKMGAPRSDDIARALLKAVEDALAANPQPTEVQKIWRPLLMAAARHLVERGFDKDQAVARITKAVGYPPPRR
jgi:hypothetical protein